MVFQLVDSNQIHVHFQYYLDLGNTKIFVPFMKAYVIISLATNRLLE